MASCTVQSRKIGRYCSGWLLVVTALIATAVVQAHGIHNENDLPQVLASNIYLDTPWLMPPKLRPTAKDQIKVSIIIDDLGDHHREGMAAIALPGALTYAVLPKTPFARELAITAYCAGKEIMLHQPMEAVAGNPLGPGGITEQMSLQQMERVLRENLQAVPYASGMNNHMGSRLTQNRQQMSWIMRAMQQIDPQLYFIDSRTTTETVALQVAQQQQMSAASRNVFLDHTPTPEAIALQFQRMITLAQQNGTAIAIAHTYPVTVATLRKLIPTLQQHNIELVHVSRLLQIQAKRGPLWQASLSP